MVESLPLVLSAALLFLMAAPPRVLGQNEGQHSPAFVSVFRSEENARQVKGVRDSLKGLCVDARRYSNNVDGNYAETIVMVEGAGSEVSSFDIQRKAKSELGNPCVYMESDAFKFFLKTVKAQVPEGQVTRGWEAKRYTECRRLPANDVHEPPVCVAYAYFLLPFDLAFGGGDALSDCVERQQQRQQQEQERPLSSSDHSSRYDEAAKYDIKVFAVESKPEDKKHCTLARSACRNGIDVDFIGTNIRREIPTSLKFK
eukprot:jgi/Bigna1/79593/fgenesh1_pg.63_\